MRVPEGSLAIPILGGDGPLSVCVLIETPSGGDPRLRQLRTTADSVVYAGCLSDHAGNVREWLEVWVQSPPAASDDRTEKGTSNGESDHRWRALVGLRSELEPERVLRCAWDTNHPRPMLLDAASCSAVVPGEGSDGGPWTLCTDDAALQRAGKPGYADGTSRFLWRAEQGELVDCRGEDWRSALDVREGLIPFNVHGGLMNVRRMSEAGFEDYVDWLSRGRFHMLPRLRFDSDSTSKTGEDPAGAALVSGGFLPSVGGAAGIVAEVLYLKIRAIASAVRSVRQATARLRSPLLSLGAESFGVDLGSPDAGLPFAWGSRVHLDSVCEARELASLDRGAPRSFTYASAGQTGVYRPGGDAGPTVRVMGVRIKRVVPIEAGSVSLEGTVLPREPVRTGAGTVASIPVALAGQRLLVHAHLSRNDALSQGEYSFRSFRLGTTVEAEEELRRLEGVDLGDAPVTVSPSLSTPADLHALGVLALRTLVARTPDSLGTAVVTAMSLAAELPESGDDGPSVTARTMAVAQSDSRWTSVLGPSCMMTSEELADTVGEVIPQSLWWGLIGTVCRMFPGAGPDSYCSDYGVAVGRPLESVFDGALSDLLAHLHRARSLLIVDRRTCEEIGEVLERQLSLVTAGG